MSADEPTREGTPDSDTRSLEHTNDPVEALSWAGELLGPASPAAFLLAPSRFAFAERTAESFALTLHDDQWFGAAYGANPPLRPEWDTCFIGDSTSGDRVGRLHLRDHWDFYSRSLDDGDGATGVDEIDDDAAIRALLSSSAPHSRVWPGDPELVAWLGVYDDEGLASVAALVRWESGYHVISSVATRVNARGRGLGQRVVESTIDAAASRRLGWLGLGVGHDNLVAKRLYERVGFTQRARYSVYRSAQDPDDQVH